MKNTTNTYVINYMFSDQRQTKYVIHRRNFYEAKQDARETKDDWNDSGGDVYIKDFSIKEIRNEDNRQS